MKFRHNNRFKIWTLLFDKPATIVQLYTFQAGILYSNLRKENYLSLFTPILGK